MKLPLFFISIFSLSCIIYSGLVLHTIQITQENAILSQQQIIATNTFDKIDRFIYGVGVTSQSMSQSYLIQQYLLGQNITKNQLQQKLDSIAATYGFWDNLVLLDNNNRVTAFTKNALTPKDIAEVVAHKQSFYISDYMTTSTPEMFFVTPVQDPNSHASLGTIVAYLSWGSIQQLLHETHVYAALMNTKGGVISEDDPYTNINIDNTRSNNITKNFTTIQQRTTTAPLSQSILGVNVYQSIVSEKGFQTYQGYRWKLILEQPTSVLFAGANIFSIQVTMMFIVVTFALLILSIFFLKVLGY